MLQILPVEEYALLYNIQDIHVFPLISSVIYNKQDGYIFVDDRKAIDVVFILHKSGFSYLRVRDDINYNLLFDFFYECTLIPQYFHIYNASLKLLEVSTQRKDFNNRQRKRMRLESVADLHPLVVQNNYIFKSVNEVDEDVFSLFNLNVIGKYWRSMQELAEEGCGYVIFDGDKPVSICYLVCLVNNNSEPDILTLPEYRGKGLATIACSHLLEMVRRKKINMEWDVFEDNIPSIKVIEKFGYAPYMHYDFLSLYKVVK